MLATHDPIGAAYQAVASYQNRQQHLESPDGHVSAGRWIPAKHDRCPECRKPRTVADAIDHARSIEHVAAIHRVNPVSLLLASLRAES